ncbi:hypothetical protein N406_07365 [Helicobacter pylori FD577]|nr:hypothetical protein N406_07365 [Helicobacter pylori FD577]
MSLNIAEFKESLKFKKGILATLFYRFRFYLI